MPQWFTRPLLAGLESTDLDPRVMLMRILTCFSGKVLTPLLTPDPRPRKRLSKYILEHNKKLYQKVGLSAYKSAELSVYYKDVMCGRYFYSSVSHAILHVNESWVN